MAPLAIEAFVTAWTAFYKTLDSIGFFPPQRHYVEYPPHNPSVPVPLTPQPDMPLHPLVLELLPLLPYPPNDGYVESSEIMPRTNAITYIDHRTLRWGRDPLNYYISELPRVGANGIVGTLEEGEIMLTTQSPNGMTLILDVVNGTIREYSASDMPPGPEELLAVPDDPEHPHNWPALPAVETVWSYVEKIKSLEWIPFRADSDMSFIESYAEEHAELRQILIENYGWPNAFRREDWINEKETVVKSLRDKIPWLSGRVPVPLQYL